jgi:hypothetical protein
VGDKPRAPEAASAVDPGPGPEAVELVEVETEREVVDKLGRRWSLIDHNPPYWHCEITSESRWEAPDPTAPAR